MPRRKADGVGPRYLTTFMVAKKLGVSPPTVVNWVNSGLLPAHRTPGGHRRIAREDIRAFAQEHDYPLPADFEDDEELPSAAAPTPRATNGPHKVLVVDDQREFCTLVRDYLVLRGGYEVEIADSGFAAGYAVAQFKPEVILMDILMPDMDGFEVLRMLQADPETRSIPVIACTAYRDPHVEERVKREAFVDYMEKPLRLDRLADVVASAINARASRS